MSYDDEKTPPRDNGGARKCDKCGSGFSGIGSLCEDCHAAVEDFPCIDCGTRFTGPGRLCSHCFYMVKM